MYEAIPRKVKGIADSMRAQAEVILPLDYSYPITYNEPKLMAQMLPTLTRTAGETKVELVNAVTGAEDFSFFQEQVPGLFLFVGGKPLDVAKKDAPPHHTPSFKVDDAGMRLGVELLTNLTLDYMQQHK
jgi:amidohydrolase